MLLTPEAGFLPGSLIIPRHIVPTDNLPEIYNTLISGVESKSSIGIRSVSDKNLFGGCRLPWEMEIKSKEQVEKFINMTLPHWQAIASSCNYQICQLIIMENDPGIGTKMKRPDQFVFSISYDVFKNHTSDRYPQSQFVIEMATETNQLRTLDKLMNKSNGNIIRHKRAYNSIGKMTSAEIQIGISYLKKESQKKAQNLFLRNVSLPNMKLDKVEKTSADTITSVLSQIDNLINDPYIQLLKRLEFFSDLGLNITEFQGYIDQKGKRKFYLYGFKGIKDDIDVGLTRYDYSEEAA